MSPPVLPSASRRYLIFTGLILAMVLGALDQSIVSTALPVISSDLGGLSRMTWVVTAFMLTSTISAPLYGKLSDMYGRKPFFAASVIVFLVASGLCGAAHSMLQLIVFRGLQGLGAGGLITLSQTVIGSIVSPGERGRYQGLFTGAFAVSSVAGPLLGGFITTHFSWRWIFYVNVPVGLLSLAIVMASLPGLPRGGRHRIDYTGAALVSVGTSALLLMLNTNEHTLARDLPLAVSLAVLVVLSFGLLYRVEKRAAEPIIDFRLLTIRAYAICVTASGTMAFAMMGSLVFVPLYFQLVLGQTPQQAGLMMLPQVLTMLVSSIVGGQISTRTRRFASLLALGTLLECAGLAALATFAHLGAGVPWFLLTMALLGAGMGIGMPNATVIVQNSVPASAIGAATATMSFVRSLGGSLGVAFSGGIMTFVLGRQLGGMPSGVNVEGLLAQGAGTVAQLSATQRSDLIEAYRSAIGASLIAGGIVMFVGFLLALHLARADRSGQGFAAEQN
ncbi:MDR family MFS transporter [Paraburkholderia sp. BCC1886]|uniref:MDR family MFS transporter n=1 Tax=Paraburkholderia sp. BCC1886 TaxID=2562670 RepID=UPI001182641B|nr:MDR family MFS transporter [Paraburkholderia sp. BCC1886]